MRRFTTRRPILPVPLSTSVGLSRCLSTAHGRGLLATCATASALMAALARKRSAPAELARMASEGLAEMSTIAGGSARADKPRARSSPSAWSRETSIRTTSGQWAATAASAPSPRSRSATTASPSVSRSALIAERNEGCGSTISTRTCQSVRLLACCWRSMRRPCPSRGPVASAGLPVESPVRQTRARRGRSARGRLGRRSAAWRTPCAGGSRSCVGSGRAARRFRGWSFLRSRGERSAALAG